jgi:hypothetical protein
VSFSKDNTEILKETVLNPIREGHQLLVSGGKFIVLDNDYNLQFSLCNTSNRTVPCNCPVQVYLAGDLKFYAQMSERRHELFLVHMVYAPPKYLENIL